MEELTKRKQTEGDRSKKMEGLKAKREDRVKLKAEKERKEEEERLKREEKEIGVKKPPPIPDDVPPLNELNNLLAQNPSWMEERRLRKVDYFILFQILILF